MSDGNNLPTMSNPRTSVVIDDWPIGRQTCMARFWTEHKPGKGERVCRQTENKTRDGWNKPKRLTYSRRCAIVDGDDGKTYILELTQYGFVNVMHGDMKYTAGAAHDGDPRFLEFRRLLDSRTGNVQEQ